MINTENVIKNFNENLNMYFKNVNIEYKIINFNDYLEKINIVDKKNNYYFIGPDRFFENIAKDFIYQIKTYADNIYNIRFIQKNNIVEETNISLSLECIFINYRGKIQIIKIIIHIFQYDDENCVLKLIPLCNITSKSIYIDIHKNTKTKTINEITSKLENLELISRCTYYPKTGKNKGIRCENEIDIENKKTNILLCNKHKRFCNNKESQR